MPWYGPQGGMRSSTLARRLSSACVKKIEGHSDDSSSSKGNRNSLDAGLGRTSRGTRHRRHLACWQVRGMTPRIDRSAAQGGSPGRRPRLAAFLLAGVSHFLGASAFAADRVERVYFPSQDGRTELMGYLFSPGTAGPHPAMVLLHGRGGPYAAHVATACTHVRRDQPSACGADTLSPRHLFWARQWVRRGFVALHVDSFGPRGKAHGAEHLAAAGGPGRAAVPCGDGVLSRLRARCASRWRLSQQDAAAAGTRRGR